jgi:tRNA modification GTPase
VLLVREEEGVDGLESIISEHSLPIDRLTVVTNKIDLSGAPAGKRGGSVFVDIGVSALTGAGIEALKDHIKGAVGFRGEEGVFSARQRHLDALTRAKSALENGAHALSTWGAGELLAEDLRAAHACLGEIVGVVSSDALLGEIFSRFCIGK